jgi:hypothetical protein
VTGDLSWREFIRGGESDHVTCDVSGDGRHVLRDGRGMSGVAILFIPVRVQSS